MGEPDWIEQWVETWGDKMTRLAFLITRNQDTAHDAAQEAFLRLYRRHQQDPDAAISVGWLYAVTRNLARDARRKQRRRPEMFPIEAEDGTGPPFEADLITRIDVVRALGRLSEADRECLWLFYYAGLSTPQMAEALNVTNESIRARLSRARRRFASVWEEDSSHAER